MNIEHAIKFFHEWAGYSWDPKTETEAEGRARGAHKLAYAEEWARTMGYSFHWDYDPTIDSSEFSDDKPAWALWRVVMRDEHGEVCDSLGGVDFGRDGEPWDNPYRRVCEAEMALEAMARIRASVRE